MTADAVLPFDLDIDKPVTYGEVFREIDRLRRLTAVQADRFTPDEAQATLAKLDRVEAELRSLHS